MEATATLRFARVSAQKARLVADLVRGKDAGEALDILKFLPKKTAPMIQALLESAVANAEHAAQRQNRELDIDRLYVKAISVDAGQTMRRFRPRAQGRATPILKKTAHITVVLDERQE
ncbi:MAG: 50S ribosomal protein L22 [Myxococcota bacterium]